MKNNEIISNIFKTLVIILGLIGIFCFNVKNGDLATNFFYYTILTNTVCIISAAFFLYKDLLHKKYSVSRENRLNIYKISNCFNKTLVQKFKNFRYTL